MHDFVLNEEQLSILRNIYSKRFKLLAGIFTALPVFLSYALLKADYEDTQKNTVITWTNAIIILIILGTLAYLYLKKIIPVQKDIAQKSGYYDNKIIMQKSAFEHVNQYYLFFDDVHLPNKEITQEEFIRYQIGDAYPLPLGKNSNLVLDGFMNYDLF